MSTERFGLLLWVVAVLVFWACFARDVVSIAVAIAFTLPHSLYLLRQRPWARRDAGWRDVQEPLYCGADRSRLAAHAD